MDPSTLDHLELVSDEDAWVDELRQWDASWAEQYMGMSRNPWQSGALSRKTVELVCVALYAACTTLDAGTRRHIRADLDAGAAAAEIKDVLKLCVAFDGASLQLGVPILAEELSLRGQG